MSFNTESGSYLDLEHTNDDVFLEPERRLLFAIFERAIRDFLSDSEYYEDAKSWFYNKEDFYTFSCPWICDYLGIDHDQLIEKVENLRFVCKARGGGTREIYEILGDYEKFGMAA